jgi:hypothetical protein
MDNLRPMPDLEKFQHALDMVDLYQKHVLPFVEEHLGFAEMHNLRAIWQAGIGQIREDDSDENKYIQAYSNWLWVAHCSHNTLAEQLSSEGVLEYKRLLLRLYIQKMDNLDLFIPRALKMHKSLAKIMLYDMQWMTPMEIVSANRLQVTCLVRHCKILQTPGTDRICRVDCRNIGTAYAKQLYNLKRVTVPANHGCTITLTPIQNHVE